MAGVNKVILVGNLGKDPEYKKTPSGASVVNFSIATSESFTGKDGQRQDETEWHSIVLWNKQADLAQQYLKKGSKVYLEGKLKTREWDDQEGNKRYKTEVIGFTMQFLDSKQQGQQGQQQQQGQQGQQQQQYGAPQQPHGANYPQQGQPYAAPQPIGDNLPF